MWVTFARSLSFTITFLQLFQFISSHHLIFGNFSPLFPLFLLVSLKPQSFPWREWGQGSLWWGQTFEPWNVFNLLQTILSISQSHVLFVLLTVVIILMNWEHKYYLKLYWKGKTDGNLNAVRHAFVANSTQAGSSFL